ncbi:hypothetical protein PV328_001345 [Microctonus aethiopoides]|uniref:Uncharacterized protein n=1 Tax=Microctonus aethiopoides TaxID=144406 RepID=A0AA39FX79_9HYME|nr:hypothetical protein PV328_001345 [Microctonus aethiopoides]
MLKTTGAQLANIVLHSPYSPDLQLVPTDYIARTHERKLARNPAFAPVPSPSREPAATNPALNSIRKPVLTPEQPPVLEPAPDPSREPCLNPIPRNSFEISA